MWWVQVPPGGALTQCRCRESFRTSPMLLGTNDLEFEGNIILSCRFKGI